MFSKIKKIKDWFLYDETLKQIQQDLAEQHKAIKIYLTELSLRGDDTPEYCTITKQMCRSQGLLMWEKDKQHRYTYLNSRHCNDFYQLPLTKVKQIIGKTDAEAMIDFEKRTGQVSTFGKMCTSTDDMVLQSGKLMRFWELGYIDDKILILDIHKQPILSGSEITGTRGWALNMSEKECEIKTLLEIYVPSGQAEPIFISEDNKVAAYKINKKSNPFNGSFPR